VHEFIVLRKVTRHYFDTAQQALVLGLSPCLIKGVLVYHVSFQGSWMELFPADFALRLDFMLLHFVSLQLEFENHFSTNLALNFIVLWVLLVFVLEKRGFEEEFTTNITPDFVRFINRAF
jgi:hypothetical protein